MSDDITNIDPVELDEVDQPGQVNQPPAEYDCNADEENADG